MNSRYSMRCPCLVLSLLYQNTKLILDHFLFNSSVKGFNYEDKLVNLDCHCIKIFALRGEIVFKNSSKMLNFVSKIKKQKTKTCKLSVEMGKQ